MHHNFCDVACREDLVEDRPFPELEHFFPPFLLLGCRSQSGGAQKNMYVVPEEQRAAAWQLLLI